MVIDRNAERLNSIEQLAQFLELTAVTRSRLAIAGLAAQCSLPLPF